MAERVISQGRQGTAGQHDGTDRAAGCDPPQASGAVIYSAPLGFSKDGGHFSAVGNPAKVI